MKMQLEVGGLLAALKDCSSSKDLQRGRHLHSKAIEHRLLSNIYVANSIINMYAKCNCMAQAQALYDTILHPSLVTFNCLLQGYADNHHSDHALHLFDSLSEEHTPPDSNTFIAALTACGKLAAGESKKSNSDRNSSRMRNCLERVRRLHSLAVSTNSMTFMVETKLVHVYAKCGSMSDARKLFEEMERPDVVTWTCMIKGYVDNGESELALDLFHAMQRDGCSPDARTYVAALSACTSLAVRAGGNSEERSRWLETGKAVHSRAVATRWCNLYVDNMLLDLFSKCGRMKQARGLFDGMVRVDTVSWNSLLQGYVQSGDSELALELFDRMESCRPDSVTYVTALTACCNLAAKENRSRWLERGKALHSAAVRRRCCDMFVETTVVDLYARCGHMGYAREVFDRMRSRDVASWNCLIQGYVDNGESSVALELINRMEEEGVGKSWKTYAAAFMACGSLMAVDKGRKLHGEVWKRGLEREVASFLVEFYGKCGDVLSAKKVFDSIEKKDVWAWNALMCGYSHLGDTGRVFELFERMKDQHILPNKITFTYLLAACSHSGECGKGKLYFKSMRSVHGMSPDRIHYNCMVDMLSRGNLLDEAVRMVEEEMPFEADSVSWTAVLGGSLKWKNVKVARVAYEEVLKLDENDPAAYNLMANVYASYCTGMRMRDEGGEVAKSSRCRFRRSVTWWTEADGKVHKFVNG